MSELESSVDSKDYIRSVLSANAQWAKRVNQTFSQYFPSPRDKQEPKILWIGCSDSRVQESDAITALPGNAFVHRNIANQFHLHDDNVLSVFAYAVGVLGVRHIAIVGHEDCGGALTALRRARPPPDVDQAELHHTYYDSLYHPPHACLPDKPDKPDKHPRDAITRWLTPLVHRIEKLELPDDDDAALKIVVRENVKMQIESIAQMEWMRTLMERPIWVHGLVYDFSTGFLRDLKITEEI